MVGMLGMADKIIPGLHPAAANRPSLRVSDSLPVLQVETMSNNAEQPKVVPEDDDEPDDWYLDSL